jgi:hypothetical protein
MITKSGRNLVLNQSRIYTLQDKISEQPISMFGSDIVNSKRGNLRQIHPGRCYDFLGTNEYVDCGDHDDFSFTDGSDVDKPFSVSFWVYMDSSVDFPMITKGTGLTINGEWYIYSDNWSILYFRVVDISASSCFLGRQVFSDISGYINKWTFFTCTYDGLANTSSPFGIKIYINGIQSDDQDCSGNASSYVGMENTSLNLDIGRHWNVSTSYADGKMHDVRIHSKELSKKEIWEVMYGKPSGYEVGWWKMEEGGGDISFDSSGRGHHGTVENATLSTFHVNSSTLPYSFLNNGGYSSGRYYPGTADIISPTDSCTDLNPGTGDYSIDGWFFNNGSTGTNNTILSKGGGSSTVAGYFIWLNTSNILVTRHSDGTNQHQVISAAAIPYGWNYFCMVVDRGYAVQQYVNLLDVRITAQDEQIDVQPSTIFSFGSYNSGSHYNDSYIGTIRYTARALTLSEVRDAYNNGFVEDSDTKMIAQFDSYGNYVDIVGDRPFFYETTTPIYIPKDETSASKDVSGEVLKYLGEVKYNTSVSSMCADFDGTDDHIIIKDNDLFSFGDGVTDSPFSVSAWIKADDISNFNVIGKYGTNNEWLLYFNASDLVYFYLYDNVGGGYIGRYLDTDYSDWEGDWLHAVATYDGSGIDGIKVYINSERVDNNNVSGGSYTAMSDTNQDIEIGKRTTNYSNGSMCDVRIFNKELSKSEIESVMGGEKNGSEVAWYPLADGNGEVVHDVSGNNLHGVVTNATLSTFWGQTQDKFHYNNRRGFSDGLYFNGTTADGIILAADAGDFNPGTNDFTVEIILKGGGINDYLIEKRGGSGNGWEYFLTANEKPHFFMQDGIASVNSTADITIDDGKIHYIAISVDRDGNVTHYLDGVFNGDDSVTNVSASVTSSAGLAVGSIGGSTNFLDSNIYGIRYSDKARTADEIFYSYKYGMEMDEHTVALWDFKDGLGINVVDENDNNLTLTNTEQVRMPALSTNLSKDILGHPLQHTGGGLNGSGDIIDFTGGVASPRLNDHRLGYVDLNGTDDYIDCGDHDDLSFGDGTDDSPFSVSAWINMNDATDFVILNKVTPSNAEWFFTVDGSDDLTLTLFDDIVSNNVFKSILNITKYEGEWIHVVATYDGRGGSTAYNGINLYLNGQLETSPTSGSNGTYLAMNNLTAPMLIGTELSDYADGYIRDVKIYGNEITADQVKEDYKIGGVNGVRLIRNFKLSKDAYDSSINREHGSIKGTNINFPKAIVDTSYEQGDYSPHPFYKKDFGSMIECVTAGRLFSSFNQVYGIWEFDWYKDLDASIIEFEFMSDIKTSGSGYGIKFSGSEAVVLEKNVSGTPSTLMSTAVSYLDIDTWYSIKVVRNSAENEYVNGAVGTFGVYVDGVLATASTGTNPVTDNTYTTSGFMIFDIDAGDKIKNFKFDNELVNLSKFQVDSESFKVSGEKENNFVLLERPLIQQASSRSVFRYTKTGEA